MAGFHGFGGDHPVLADRLRVQKTVSEIINETKRRLSAAGLKRLGCHAVFENMLDQLTDTGPMLPDHRPVFGLGIHQQGIELRLLVDAAAMLAHQIEQQAFELVIRRIGGIDHHGQPRLDLAQPLRGQRIA